ncbi:MAG: acylneuraminate cytidylyltransferase family protein [Chromatiales bacterium]|jgi:N-acylneuraminate cytidylyltransferase
MINGLHVLGIITARGGSKGLPGKNIKPLAGKPLINWTIDAALASKYLDRTILSSDDQSIIEVAQAAGCDVPFVRPAQLATDEAGSMDVLLHAVNELPDYDIIVVLQPTSPLRRTQDIDVALELMLQENASSCVSVTLVSKSPHWSYSMNADLTLRPLLSAAEQQHQRQQLPDAYALNGAVYAITRAHLLEQQALVNEDTVAYVMPKQQSIDIDDEIDFRCAEALLSR